MPPQSTLIGAAGEYFVLSQLLRRGWVAAIAPEGVPNTDIIITDVEGNRQFAIQVKTRSKGTDKGWHMNKKHEEIVSNTLIYCFVDMEQEGELPVTFLIPSKVVAKTLKDAHQFWLDTPGKKGQKHNDNKMRRLIPDYIRGKDCPPSQQKRLGKGWMDQHRENWNLLIK